LIEPKAWTGPTKTSDYKGKAALSLAGSGLFIQAASTAGTDQGTQESEHLTPASQIRFSSEASVQGFTERESVQGFSTCSFMAAAFSSHHFRQSKLSALILALATVVAAARAQLSPTFYASSCPAALVTIKTAVRAAVVLDRRMGGSLLRLHFHDCFVQASPQQSVEV
jgi:peroxidase